MKEIIEIEEGFGTWIGQKKKRLTFCLTSMALALMRSDLCVAGGPTQADS